MRPAIGRLNRYGFRSLPPLILSSEGYCKNVNFILLNFRFYSTRLAEVGRFELQQSDDHCYPAGQAFLHRIFGYRGITLFPWLARVHEQYSTDGGGSISNNIGATESHHHKRQNSPYYHANKSQKSGSKKDDSNKNHGNESSTDEIYNLVSEMSKQSTKCHPYYQVLIDTRDCPFVSSRTQTEAVTFLGHPDSSKSVYSIRGLDYVAHEDILPYTSHEEQPIEHELYCKLFKFDSPETVGNACGGNNESKSNPSDLLGSWKDKHPWLALSRVYRKTTENVRVTVIPFYLGHTTMEGTSFHWWRYSVRLENLSDACVQLRERHWKIFNETNMLQTIKGRGVVGVEPWLSKIEPAYQYSSHVNFQDKSGFMWGTFKMQRENGSTFECSIPTFLLESSIDPTSPKHEDLPT